VTSTDLHTSSGRLLVEGYLFYDGAGNWCVPQPYHDSFLCVPPLADRIDVLTTFADAACTVPLLIPLGSDPSTGVGVAYDQSTCARTITGLYTIGAASIPSIYYQRFGDGPCTAAGDTPIGAQIATPVDPSALPLLSLRIE
jgi:hypothetical protein